VRVAVQVRRFLLVATLLALSGGRAFAQSEVTDKYDETFRKYSKRYFGPAFDWRLFKAQAMAESNLQTRAKSQAGARGIMQLMPGTFREIRSKNPEITGKWDHPEWNIAAGIAYSRQLWTLWVNDLVVDHVREFMLSSYNAGRMTLLRAQRIAEERALNPRVWPSIETVAPVVPRWRYDETLSYIGRVLDNLADMDPHGNIVPRRTN
jgi:membrane-bound lytic murein transglycosylase F